MTMPCESSLGAATYRSVTAEEGEDSPRRAAEKKGYQLSAGEGRIYLLLGGWG